MPHTHIWIHAVWSTKNRYPFLHEEWRQVLFERIRIIAASKRIYLDKVNGYTDHIHCLLNLYPTQSLSKVIKDIKGVSSHWVNKQGLTERPFRWQKEYYAISVSQSAIPFVRAYIDNQEIHHQHKEYNQEICEFVRLNGLKKLRDWAMVMPDEDF